MIPLRMAASPTWANAAPHPTRTHDRQRLDRVDRAAPAARSTLLRVVGPGAARCVEGGQTNRGTVPGPERGLE